jgi:hypothetical protein
MCRILSYADVDDAQGMAFYSCRYDEDALFIKRVRQHKQYCKRRNAIGGRKAQHAKTLSILALSRLS